MHRYGAAIEADLAFRTSYQLGPLWRTGQFRLLLNLIDHLPRNSFYSEAISQDDEIALAYLDRRDGIRRSGQEAEDRRPPLSEETPELTELREVNDRLASVLLAIRAFGKGSLPKIPPRDRPQVAAERVRQQLRHVRHRSLVDRVLPGRR